MLRLILSSRDLLSQTTWESVPGMLVTCKGSTRDLGVSGLPLSGLCGLPSRQLSLLPESSCSLG